MLSKTNAVEFDLVEWSWPVSCMYNRVPKKIIPVITSFIVYLGIKTMVKKIFRKKLQKYFERNSKTLDSNLGVTARFFMVVKFYETDEVLKSIKKREKIV